MSLVRGVIAFARQHYHCKRKVAFESISLGSALHSLPLLRFPPTQATSKLRLGAALMSARALLSGMKGRERSLKSPKGTDNARSGGINSLTAQL